MNKTSASTRTASSVTEEDIEVGTLDDWSILEMLADQINFAAR